MSATEYSIEKKQIVLIFSLKAQKNRLSALKKRWTIIIPVKLIAATHVHYTADSEESDTTIHARRFNHCRIKAAMVSGWLRSSLARCVGRSRRLSTRRFQVSLTGLFQCKLKCDRPAPATLRNTATPCCSYKCSCASVNNAFAPSRSLLSMSTSVCSRPTASANSPSRISR